MAYKLEKLTFNRFSSGLYRTNKQILFENSELYESFIEIEGSVRNYKVVRSKWYIQRPIDKVEQRLTFDIYVIRDKNLYPVTMGKNLETYEEVRSVLTKIENLSFNEITKENV